MRPGSYWQPRGLALNLKREQLKYTTVSMEKRQIWQVLTQRRASDVGNLAIGKRIVQKCQVLVVVPLQVTVEKMVNLQKLEIRLKTKNTTALYTKIRLGKAAAHGPVRDLSTNQLRRG